MKGLFIPDITAEMFRNASLDGIEELMNEGEIYDIDYEPEPHWIPCKERLPEIGEHVLTCISEFDDGCMGIDFLEKHIGGLHWMNDHGDLTDLEAITAWLPLPKPYKEGKE